MESSSTAKVFMAFMEVSMVEPVIVVAGGAEALGGEIGGVILDCCSML